MAQGTTVTMYSRPSDTHANNISAKESWGHKKRENLFVNLFVVQAQVVFLMSIVKQNQQTIYDVQL